jgi:GNAT superfamily N-acetyltransferase
MTTVIKPDPACQSAISALENDPFYQSICGAHASSVGRRRATLERYFDYSIREGRDFGRCVHLANPAIGVAVWLLPQAPDAQLQKKGKRAFLEATLDEQGCANYYRMVDFMHVKAAGIVGDDAWYLSIVAVDPSAQGQGLGRTLLEPTIAEADRISAICYLETFSPRSVSFYERLGFITRARFMEPTACAHYALMVRYAPAFA